MTRKNKPTTERKTIEVTSMSVNRATEWDDGGVTFDCTINGITIYGCRVVESKKGDFIGFPSRKAKDGNYYNHVYAPLTEEQMAELLNLVSEKLDQ